MSWSLLIQLAILMILLYLIINTLIEKYFQHKAVSRIIEYHKTVSMTPEQAGVEKIVKEI